MTRKVNECPKCKHEAKGFYEAPEVLDVEDQPVVEGWANEWDVLIWFQCQNCSMNWQVVYPADKVYFRDIEEDEEYITLNSLHEFEKWIRKAGWKDSTDFTMTTGVSFVELKGKAFTIIHNRVYFNK